MRAQQRDHVGLSRRAVGQATEGHLGLVVDRGAAEEHVALRAFAEQVAADPLRTAGLLQEQAAVGTPDAALEVRIAIDAVLVGLGRAALPVAQQAFLVDGDDGLRQAEFQLLQFRQEFLEGTVVVALVDGLGVLLDGLDR